MSSSDDGGIRPETQRSHAACTMATGCMTQLAELLMQRKHGIAHVHDSGGICCSCGML